jgi:hypothetical protein
MIGRKTGVTLMLALVLGSGIAMWVAWHPDSCSRYLRGEPTLPSTQEVEMGGRTVYVPCEQWYPRQTMAMQTACLVEFALIGVLVVFAAGDGVDWWRRRAAR